MPTVLKKENFDQTVLKEKRLLVFFYKEDDAESMITLSSLNEVEQMFGRDFYIYSVNSFSEPEICDACSVTKTPEIISIIDAKIYKRKTGILKSNEILNLLK